MNNATITHTGTFGNDYTMNVDGIHYGFTIRNNGEVTNIHVIRSDARGGLKTGSKQWAKVAAAIEADKSA